MLRHGGLCSSCYLFGIPQNYAGIFGVSPVNFYSPISSLPPLPSEVVAHLLLLLWAIANYTTDTTTALFRARMNSQAAHFMMNWSSFWVVPRTSCDTFLSSPSISSPRASLCGRLRFCLPRSPLGTSGADKRPSTESIANLSGITHSFQSPTVPLSTCHNYRPAARRNPSTTWPLRSAYRIYQHAF